MLITGGSRQSPQWVAENGDGWMTYPRDVGSQARVVADYRDRVSKDGGTDKPVMQSLYVDLLDTADALPRPIHLGFQSGTTFLKQYLSQLQDIGINHVALNLRFNGKDMETSLKHLADEVLPEFGN